MKKTRIVVLTIILISVMTSSIYGENRVICEITDSSDRSTEVELLWSEEASENLRIISWERIDDKTLKIIYDKSNSSAYIGFNKREINNPNYEFPMRIILEEQNVEPNYFNDLPTDYEAKYSILNLYYRNIIGGYPDGSFKPNNNVTRAEFSKMIVETAGYIEDENLISKFSDVSNDHWAFKYIMTLGNKGILKGRLDGSFDPSGSITIGEVLAVINRTFLFYGQDNDYNYSLASHWSSKDFLVMVGADIVKPSDDFYYPYTPDNKASREQCVILLSRVLEQLHEEK